MGQSEHRVVQVGGPYARWMLVISTTTLVVALALLMLVASDGAAAEGPCTLSIIDCRDGAWEPSNNITLAWGYYPLPTQLDFHLTLRDPEGTLLADVHGENETSYDHGPLPDSWGYNWSVHVNYSYGGGNWSGSNTSITFGIDTVPPENPTHAVMGNGTHESGVWQSNETEVVIYLHGAVDDRSGIEAYEAYWGRNPKGAPFMGGFLNRFYLGTATEGIYYFRVRAVDKAWNRAEMVTIYVHMHDGMPPLVPDVVEQRNGTTESDVWQNGVDSPRFWWEEPWDQSSGVKGYHVYLGPDPEGTSEEFITGTTWRPGPVTEGTHYMRISPVDVAGNAANWTTRYVFRYDVTPPGPVTIACTAGNLSSTGEATFIWTEPADLSGIKRYRYRLNDGAGTWVTRSTHTFEAMRDRHHVFGVAAEDMAGNLGGWSFVDLTVDTTPPSGSVSFDISGFATNVTVPLVIEAEEDTSGVEAMRFSPDGIVWGDWMPFGTEALFHLPPGDGNRSVQLELRDLAGHVSVDRMVDWVLLDTSPPSGELVIDGGASHTTSTKVTLVVTAEDANGIASMQVSEEPGEWGAVLEPFEELSFTLSPGDGTRIVRIRITDGAGLVTVVSATIVLDTEPPTGAVLINGGDEYSRSSTVNLTLEATDATSGVALVRFSWNTTGWGPWQNYTGELVYDLEPGDGERAVHVQLRDGASLVSDAVIVDTVRVDTVGPSGSVTIEGGDATTRFYTVELTFQASDANGVVDMRFSWDGETWTQWEAFRSSRTVSMPGGEGLKTVSVEFRDSSGRVSEVPATDSITYERAGDLTMVLLAAALIGAGLVALAWVRRRRSRMDGG